MTFERRQQRHHNRSSLSLVVHAIVQPFDRPRETRCCDGLLITRNYIQAVVAPGDIGILKPKRLDWFVCLDRYFLRIVLDMQVPIWKCEMLERLWPVTVPCKDGAVFIEYSSGENYWVILLVARYISHEDFRCIARDCRNFLSHWTAYVVAGMVRNEPQLYSDFLRFRPGVANPDRVGRLFWRIDMRRRVSVHFRGIGGRSSIDKSFVLQI